MSDVRKRLQRQPSVGMDGEKSRRGVLAFRCRKSLDFSAVGAPEKSVLGTRKREDLATEVFSPPKEAPAKLLEKHALLASFYEGVEAAVSLLGIRRELCTFQAVCASVEATIKRRFLQKHLAQIKYLLPEAIDLEYVRSYDSDTRSNRWELKVSLLPMPAETEEPSREGEANLKKPKIETVQRRRAFHARLAKFASTHSEEDDVPAHPMPERAYNGSSKAISSGVQPEFSMSVATTGIPMEINTIAHRVEIPQSERSPALPSHFTKSFKSVFSLKAGGPFIRNAKRWNQKSEDTSPDTILPMRINRTSHRDVHNLAEIPTGTPHLTPSFKPFFSLERSVPEPELVADDCVEPTLVSDMPCTSPLERRHAAPQEEHEIILPVELQTPIKIIRTYGASRLSTASEFESPNKRPHFSPAFKAHYSGESSSMDASRGLLRTPVKASASKEVPISWDVRTPGRISDDVHQCSPIDEKSSGLKTPLKSSIPSHSFKSPAPVTPKHQHTPCTPQVSECGESSIYVSYQAESAPHDGFKSPAATPVKQGSAIRSLFGAPKSEAGSPSLDVPSTPGMRTPMNVSRGSRFRSKEAAKQNLESLLGRNGDDDAEDVMHADNGGESSACITTSSASRTATLRKSLSFASEMSQADMNMIQGHPAELVYSD